MSKSQDFRRITAETAGKDLLGALVTEIKLLPDAWPKKQLPSGLPEDLIKCYWLEDGVIADQDLKAEDA